MYSLRIGDAEEASRTGKEGVRGHCEGERYAQQGTQYLQMFVCKSATTTTTTFVLGIEKIRGQ